MPSKDYKILEFNQYQKSDKAPCISYADLDCLIKKIEVCRNDPENTSTTKLCGHIRSRFPMSALLSFKTIENKYDVYRGKDCMKKFCESFKDHTMEIIVF